jgi:hypothetical protein
MANEDLRGVVVPKDHYLVRDLPDYYKKRKEGGLDTHMQDFSDYTVGVIEKAGVDVKEDAAGIVIYYRKDVGETLNVRGIGIYKLIPKAHVLLFRFDERNLY